MISTFTAFINSNVFHGARLRSLIIEMAQSGMFRARWSERVHQEWISSVRRRRPGIDREKLNSYRLQMDLAVPNALVSCYEQFVSSITLPDPDDRHIVAAAHAARASVIVTFNEKHFPDEVLNPLGLHTEHPDQFLLDLADLQPESFIAAVRADLKHYRSPPLTADAYAADLRKAGLPDCADEVIRLLRVLRSLEK